LPGAVRRLPAEEACTDVETAVVLVAEPVFCDSVNGVATISPPVCNADVPSPRGWFPGVDEALEADDDLVMLAVLEKSNVEYPWIGVGRTGSTWLGSDQQSKPE
jgi:hypothetical protein